MGVWVLRGGCLGRAGWWGTHSLFGCGWGERVGGRRADDIGAARGHGRARAGGVRCAAWQARPHWGDDGEASLGRLSR